MNVNLHIERLVLDRVDIAPGGRHALQAAVERELARLLTEGGLAPRLSGGGALPSVAGSAIRLSSGLEPTALGRQIAGAVYEGIGT